MPRIGSMPCLARCGTQDAAAEETAAGTLNVKCHRCGFSGYGKAGSKAKRLLAAMVVKDPDDDAAAPGAPPAPPAAPAAAPRPSTLLG